MNYIKRITIGMLAVILTVLSGCNKEYLDINQNPNQVTAATPSLVLPAALANTGAYITTNFYFLNLWMGYWNWSGNYSINTSDKNYQFTNSYNNGVWNNAYANLKNYDYMDTQGAALGQPQLQAIGKIMKAYHFHILVDTYGNVPYTEALQGLAGILPKYDDAQAIYTDLFKQVNTALDLFNQADNQAAQGLTVINPGTNDIVFGGKIDQWRKFANTLKLRMLLRQSEKADRASFIQAELATIKVSNYGFLGAGENAAVDPGYVNSQNQQSPLYGAFFAVNGNPTTTNNQYKANRYAIDFYKTANDPRLGAYYKPVVGSTTTFNATFFGTADPLANSKVSDIGAGIFKSVDQPSPILSSHESLFMQAEAAQRGWIAGSAKDYYQQAITESFLNVGRTAAEAAAYYSQAGLNNVNFDASTNKLEAIITQKWASENSLAPFEAWSDYRRLGYPRTVPVSQDPSVTTGIPVRLLYPQGEYSNNAANVAAQGTVSQFMSKLFWMK